MSREYDKLANYPYEINQSVNKLDESCLKIFYGSDKNINLAYQAHEILYKEATKRFQSGDVFFAERLAALCVVETEKKLN